MAFDYTVDYAQKAIDLAKAGAADHLIVQALADRDRKITDLGLTNKQAGSTSALKEYLSVITSGSSNKVNQPHDPGHNKLDYENSTMDIIDFNSDSFGFDPSGSSYNPTILSSGGSSSINMSNILGYVIVGLVGIVILDKIIG